MEGGHQLDQVLLKAQKAVLSTPEILLLYQLSPFKEVQDQYPSLFPLLIPHKPENGSLFVIDPSRTGLSHYLAVKNDGHDYVRKCQRNNRGIQETRQQLKNGVRVFYSLVQSADGGSPSPTLQRRIYHKQDSPFSIVHYIHKPLSARGNLSREKGLTPQPTAL